MLDSFLSKMPGFCGELARFLYFKLDTKQPGLCIAAALSFASALKADRVFCPQYNVSSNLYCIAIAEAGVGKTTCQDVILDICNKACISDLLMGEPGTHQGIRSALQAHPKQFLQWDEVGHALSELVVSKNGNRMQILSLLMRIFSANGKTLLGTELKGEDVREDIDKPYLSIFATSTPERFFEPLNESFITDGLLPRWLFFPPEPKDVFKAQSNLSTPLEFIEEVKTWQRGLVQVGKGGNLSDVSFVPPQINLRFDDAAFELTQNHFRNFIRKSKTSLERAYWRRAFEQTIKVCMTLAESDYCIVEDLEFVCEFIECVIKKSIDACSESLYDNQTQRQENKERNLIVSLLPNGNSITRSQLTKACHRINIQNRNRIIDDLLSTGQWTTEKQGNTTIYKRFGA